MALRTVQVCCLASALLAAPAVAGAQPRWGQGLVPRSGACFYQDSNFRGMYFCVQVGENVSQVPRGINDKISSIRIIGNADAIVFRDSRFRGQSARFGTDVRNLQREGWNDLISSIRIGGSSWDGGGRPPSWGNPVMPGEGACFFSEPNFRGQAFCLPRGASYALLPPGFNDRVSSIRVQRAVVVLFEDRDFDGRSSRLTGSVPSLRGAWNNRLSSVKVY